MSELNVYHHELRPDEYDEFYLKYEADKVIAHNKYRRCLAMAKICQLRAERYERYLTEYKNCDSPSTQRWQFLMKNHYEKWHRRWLELAEKFKPSKEQ